MTTKTSIAAVTALLLASGGASAADMYIDVGALQAISGTTYGSDASAPLSTANNDADTTTGIFNEFGFSQILATSIYDFSDGSPLGSFFDSNIPTELSAAGIPTSGTALDGTTTVNLAMPDCPAGQCDIDALSPLVPPLNSDAEGFLQSWDLQVAYHFDGTLTPAGPVYTGGTFDVFFNSINAAEGDLADGTLVLSGTLTGSNIQAANLDLFFDIDFALDGFLWIDNGSEFIDAGLNDVQSGDPTPATLVLDTNVNPPIPTADQLLLVGNNVIRQTTLDGSITAQIPEPSTVALLGLGMLGLGAGIRRRRRS